MRVDLPFVDILTRDFGILSTVINCSARRIEARMLIGAETIKVEFFRAYVNTLRGVGTLPEVRLPADCPMRAAVDTVRF